MENMFIRHFLSQNRLSKQLIVNNICHYFWLSINILLSFIHQNKFTCVKWTDLLDPNRHMEALTTLQASIRNYNIANIITCKQNSETSHHFSNHWACRANIIKMYLCWSKLMTQKLSSKISNVVHFWETSRPKSLPYQFEETAN